MRRRPSIALRKLEIVTSFSASVMILWRCKVNQWCSPKAAGLSNLQQLQQQRNLLKINIADASATYGANNRHLKEMQTQLRALDEQIHQELQQIVQRAQGDFQLAQVDRK